MPRKTYYRQCKLELDKGEYTIEDMAWIPEKFAKKGKILEIKNNDKEWINGWKVISVGDRVDSNCINDFHRQIQQHREVTDI